MIERVDHARLHTQRAQAQSRVANIRPHITSLVAASRQCVESSELLLAAEPRRKAQNRAGSACSALVRLPVSYAGSLREVELIRDAEHSRCGAQF